MLKATIGICAYNEEKNIGKLLQSLQDQQTKEIHIGEILIVSSASTDRTDEIVRSFMSTDKRIRLLIQEKREGKASAVNLILKNATGDIIVLASADILPLEHTIQALVLPFFDETIGMTGGHPIPIDNKNSFIGFTVHLLWELHHKLALKEPKLGEIVAFRNIIRRIPVDTAVDEAAIEAIIRKKELKLHYVADALIYNKGPSNVDDFLRQRRRIYAGHLHLKKNSGYAASSMSITNLLAIILETMSLNPKVIFWTGGAISLEFYGRLLGMYDFHIAKKNPYVWEIARTTKEVR
jgi:biofilm PGA synthesis N-glycosyltransferase PgaC